MRRVFPVAPLLLTMSALAAALPAEATETLVLDAEIERVELADQLEMVADTGGMRELADVMALGQDEWSKATTLARMPEFRQTTYWFRVNLANRSDHVLTLVLEFPAGGLNRVDLYQTAGGELTEHLVTGLEIPAEERALAHRRLVLPLALEPDSERLVYLRAFARGSFQLPLTVWRDAVFYEHDQVELLALGAYFGVLVLVLIYILVIAATLWEGYLLIFAGFIASFGIFQLALFGIGSAYIWRFQPGLDQLITFLSICAGLLCASLFTIAALELRERNVPATRFLNVMMIMTIFLSLISPLLNYEQVAPIVSALTIPTSLGILTIGVFESYRGSQMAWHFTLAWSLLLVGMVTLALNRLGLVPNNLYTEQAAFIGFVVMVIQMSWSLAREYNRQRYLNRLRTEREARAMQEALTAQLEEKVKERTQELEKALAELADANTALMELSTIDSLTGIHNRYYFDDVFVKEWKRAIREQYPISLMLVDADHFKRINDTLGHLAGDIALRHLARAIKQVLRRPADILARYGGEEFVVVLPYINNDNACTLAEQIRAFIAKSRIDAQGEEIDVTISIGVATALPQDEDDQADLISAADEALYQAKNDGRNLVRNAGLVKVGASQEPG